MRNIRLIIQYDGTNFCGWQIQKVKNKKAKVKSIQETIEEALHKILREKVTLAASGRTDAGVHAKAQVANFKIKNNFVPTSKIKKALNGILPDEVSIKDAQETRPDFHSRFDAKSKLYRYTILNSESRSPLLRNHSYHVPYKLNVAAMRNEAHDLLGRRNFRSFQASDKKFRSPIKKIKSITVKKQGECIFIDAEANGFLYNMMRNIAGTLIEIGRGKLPKGSIKKILAAKDRARAGPAAPAKGLCLMEVRY